MRLHVVPTSPFSQRTPFNPKGTQTHCLQSRVHHSCPRAIMRRIRVWVKLLLGKRRRREYSCLQGRLAIMFVILHPPNPSNKLTLYPLDAWRDAWHFYVRRWSPESCGYPLYWIIWVLWFTYIHTAETGWTSSTTSGWAATGRERVRRLAGVASIIDWNPLHSTNSSILFLAVHIWNNYVFKLLTTRHQFSSIFRLIYFIHIELNKLNSQT